MEPCNSTVTECYTHDCDTTNSKIENTAVKVGFYILYIIIFTLGVFGNALVCYVVCRNKAMQSVTNIFIMNLALSDIFLCVLAVPFTPLYTFMERWVFGNLICHLVPYAQGVSVYISTLTLTSIAIDRYFVIIYPLRPRMKLSSCLCTITSIWIFSILATLPYGIYVELRNVGDKFVCEENWPNNGFSRRIFGTFTCILQFILPFFIIAFCYVHVSSRLNDRARTKPGSKNARKEEVDRERKRKTNRMLISMVSIFGISWLPLNCINMINDFYVPSECWKYFHVSFFIGHCLAMSSTCYNPFLYAWLNDNFRKEFKQVFPCFNNRRNGFRCGRYSERTFNGTETIQETNLNSVANGDSPVRHLEPRQPIAEPIMNFSSNRHMKSETIYLSGLKPMIEFDDVL